MIEVVRAGGLTTVQDRGRPGYAHLGVPRSGALDEPALRWANALVGNEPSSAGLETTLTGCRLRLLRGCLVAVTGAVAMVTVDREPVPRGEALPVPAGAELAIGPARVGVRSYVAIAGGIDVEPVLGSRSTDTLSGLGPPVLRAGDRLTLGVGRNPATAVRAKALPAAAGRPPRAAAPEPAAGEVELAVRLGPRDDVFTRAAIEALLSSAYAIDPRSNRIGTRLTGPALTRADDGELPPEPLVLGAVQVPAGGQPLVFLADHPTTGGYPVIAVVTDVTPLAQARPGTTVRFRGPER